MPNFLDIATPLIERGFSVIPIEPRGKRPLRGIGVTQRTNAREVLCYETLELWNQYDPQANVGICADENIVILETDDLAELGIAIYNGTGKPLPSTLMACGSSVDRPHLFFKRTERATNVGNLAVPGLFEARFSNQYVVAAGSTHPSGAVYRWLNDAPIVGIPDWLVSELARLALQNRTAERTRDISLRAGRVCEGSRHYFLMRELGRKWDGHRTEEEMIEEANELNALCDPPKDTAHVIQCVRDIMRREPHDPGPKVVIGSSSSAGKGVKERMQFGPQYFRPKESVYLIGAKDDSGQYEGWFPTGEVHLVAGSSGVGKSTLLMQIFEQVRLGMPVLGHPTVPREYRVLMHDRSAGAFERTALRMGLSDAARERVHRLTQDEQQLHAVAAIDGYLKKQEAAGTVPFALFAEGLDMWVPNGEVNDFDTVSKFMDGLQRLAEAWNIALIGSVGSPKQKPKEKYMLQRDNVLGSVAWGRKAETILFLQLTNPEDPASARECWALCRNGRPERIRFEMKDGRLEEAAEPIKTEPDGVKETKARKTDLQERMITEIREMAPGTELKAYMFAYVSSSSFSRYMQTLAEGGWVGKNEQYKWIAKPK